MPKDYYATLGVAKGSSEDEIKNAFRKLAHQRLPENMSLKDKLIIVGKVIGIAAGAWFVLYWFPMIGMEKLANWKLARHGIISKEVRTGCLDIQSDITLPSELILPENACVSRLMMIPRGAEVRNGLAADRSDIRIKLRTDNPIGLAKWYRTELEKNGWTWTGPKWVGTPPPDDAIAASAHYVSDTGTSLSVLATTTSGLESVELALIK